MSASDDAGRYLDYTVGHAVTPGWWLNERGYVPMEDNGRRLHRLHAYLTDLCRKGLVEPVPNWEGRTCFRLRSARGPLRCQGPAAVRGRRP